MIILFSKFHSLRIPATRNTHNRPQCGISYAKLQQIHYISATSAQKNIKICLRDAQIGDNGTTPELIFMILRHFSLYLHIENDIIQKHKPKYTNTSMKIPASLLPVATSRRLGIPRLAQEISRQHQNRLYRHTLQRNHGHHIPQRNQDSADRIGACATPKQIYPPTCSMNHGSKSGDMYYVRNSANLSVYGSLPLDNASGSLIVVDRNHIEAGRQ